MSNYNIAQFANLAGVSTATVSRVFSGSPLVREETRKRVLQLARKHHFRPNRAAAASFHGPTRAIGIVTFGGNNSFYNELWHGVQDTLMARGYLPIALVPDDNTPLMTVFRRLYDQRVDGLITVDWRNFLTAAEEREFAGWRLPCVMVDSFAAAANDALPYDAVCDDSSDGVRQAAEHLFARGHRRCAVYTKTGDKPERTELFMRIFAKLGGETVFCGAAELPRVLRSGDAPTALFGFTDYDAADAIRLARGLGLRVPEDLSVIGFADLDFAELLNPELTTVRQNGACCGQTAAELLLQRLENPRLPPQHKLLSVHLVERKSVTAVENP